MIRRNRAAEAGAAAEAPEELAGAVLLCRSCRFSRLCRLLLPLLPLVAACELTEVTVAPGSRVVVVQSVISRTDSQQFVVVEYSQTGDAFASYDDPRIPPGSPKTPITGARVTIEHAGGAGCAGRVDTLLEQPMNSSLPATGTYVASICTPEPGERLLLRVETPRGEVVTGASTVPGASARDVSAGGLAATTGSAWTFDRARDTLQIGVTAISGKALQIELRDDADRDDLAFFAFIDTMAIRFPGNLVNPFEGDDGESIFRAGRYYVLAVALTDNNYYDFLRSRSDPFTGRGFINHLTGGIGVFGSVETERYRLRVVAPVDDPREGVYRLTGMVDTVAVDVMLELYLDEVQPDQFSAFVKGAWPGGSLDRSSDGDFPADGSGEMRLHFHVPRADTLPAAGYTLSGVRRAGGVPFPMTVASYLSGFRAAVVDTLTARQISGPGLATASSPR